MVLCAAALSTLAACSTRFEPAPVVDRSGTLLSTQPGGAGMGVPLGPPPPGYYRVKPGDTLYRVALENGQNYRDIATWNNLTNPNQIEVDQLLRVVPPGANVAAMVPGVATAPIGGGAVATRPLTGAPGGSGGPANAAMPGMAMPPVTMIPPQVEQPMAPSAQIGFAWPVHGPILNQFDDSKNKGLNIGGASGDPVEAAGDGRVVYAGNGLRGYGNLIIIKHDATYLTAYAHNRALMVKEGDSVSKGQKIAEMGNTDSDRTMLHFEVRKQGKPVDPLKYLPPQ
jgi:lipoprotein NlpD